MSPVPITLDTKVTQAATPIVSPMDEGLMMFSQETAQYYSLVDVARDIWERIGEPVLVGELCQELLRLYNDVEEEECQTQVIAFLTELQDDGLIQIVS